jgi:hypothetical protein
LHVCVRVCVCSVLLLHRWLGVSCERATVQCSCHVHVDTTCVWTAAVGQFCWHTCGLSCTVHARLRPVSGHNPAWLCGVHVSRRAGATWHVATTPAAHACFASQLVTAVSAARANWEHARLVALQGQTGAKCLTAPPQPCNDAAYNHHPRHTQPCVTRHAPRRARSDACQPTCAHVRLCGSLGPPGGGPSGSLFRSSAAVLAAASRAPAPARPVQAQGPSPAARQRCMQLQGSADTRLSAPGTHAHTSCRHAGCCRARGLH